MPYTFHLGVSSELSLLEIEAISPVPVEKISETEVKVDIADPGRVNYLANRLGGTIEVTDEKGEVFWRHSAKSWYKRDRERPFADSHKGMLPPKVARIMINLALGKKDPRGLTLLDPFCGTGTILMEGHVLGLGLIGSDLDKDQLDGADQNLMWLGAKSKLFSSDATAISTQLGESSVDLIVTEPLMGRPGTREDRLPDLAKGLSKLYLGCLKDWFKVLRPGGTICMIFPVFHYHGQDYKTSVAIDSEKLLNYNIGLRGVMYSRPDAKVRREIVLLTKK